MRAHYYVLMTPQGASAHTTMVSFLSSTNPQPGHRCGLLQVSHLPTLVVDHCLANLPLRVHDEWSLADDRFVDRGAAQEECRCVADAVDHETLTGTVEQRHFGGLDRL